MVYTVSYITEKERQNRTMKRIFFLGLTAILLLLVCSCSIDTNKTDEEKISIVTTIFPTYDFSKNIVGELGEVTLLLKPGEESHSYEPTPQDIIKIQSCDVFVYVGGMSDAWVETLLRSIDTSKIKLVTLLDCVSLIENVGGHQHNDENEHNGVYDEHIWTSPKNAVKMTKRISEAIISADSENVESYKKNTEKYIEELDELDSIFSDIVENKVLDTIIVGDRFPFIYLTKEYGINYFSAFDSCSDESEVSASTVAELVEETKKRNIKIVFQIEMSSGRIADSIASETVAEVRLLHSCNNISRDEWESGETYISLMKNNAKVLKEALGSKDK